MSNFKICFVSLFEDEAFNIDVSENIVSGSENSSNVNENKSELVQGVYNRGKNCQSSSPLQNAHETIELEKERREQIFAVTFQNMHPIIRLYVAWLVILVKTGYDGAALRLDSRNSFTFLLSSMATFTTINSMLATGLTLPDYVRYIWTEGLKGNFRNQARLFYVFFWASCCMNFLFIYYSMIRYPYAMLIEPRPFFCKQFDGFFNVC